MLERELIALFCFCRKTMKETKAYEEVTTYLTDLLKENGS